MRLTKIKSGILFILLLLGVMGIWAQEPPQILTETTAILLQTDTPTRVQIEGKVGDIVLVTAVGGEVIDTIITLINAEGEKIAYADDQVLDGDIVRDAHLIIRWTEDTTYTVLVDSFNGVSEGEITLQLERIDTTLPLKLDERMSATLFEGSTLRLNYEAEKRETVVISVRDISSTLDPIVRVLDGNGQVLAVGDDNTDSVSGLNTLDTQLTLDLPTAGVYTLEVIDFLGRAGKVEITVKLAP